MTTSHTPAPRHRQLVVVVVVDVLAGERPLQSSAGTAPRLASTDTHTHKTRQLNLLPFVSLPHVQVYQQSYHTQPNVADFVLVSLLKFSAAGRYQKTAPQRYASGVIIMQSVRIVVSIVSTRYWILNLPSTLHRSSSLPGACHALALAKDS